MPNLSWKINKTIQPKTINTCWIFQISMTPLWATQLITGYSWQYFDCTKTAPPESKVNCISNKDVNLSSHFLVMILSYFAKNIQVSHQKYYNNSGISAKCEHEYVSKDANLEAKQYKRINMVFLTLSIFFNRRKLQCRTNVGNNMRFLLYCRFIFTTTQYFNTNSIRLSYKSNETWGEVLFLT